MQKIFVFGNLKEAMLVLSTREQICGYVGIVAECNLRVTCPGGHTINTYIQVQRNFLPSNLPLDHVVGVYCVPLGMLGHLGSTRGQGLRRVKVRGHPG